MSFPLFFHFPSTSSGSCLLSSSHMNNKAFRLSQKEQKTSGIKNGNPAMDRVAAAIWLVRCGRFSHSCCPSLSGMTRQGANGQYGYISTTARLDSSSQERRYTCWWWGQDAGKEANPLRLCCFDNPRSETGTAKPEENCWEEFPLDVRNHYQQNEVEKQFYPEEAGREARFEKICWLWHLYGTKIISITPKDLNLWPSPSM